MRQATDSDLEAVQRLQRLWEEEEATHGFVAAPVDQLRGRLGAYFLVAEADKMVGFLCASVHVSPGLAVAPAGARYVEIDDLYVHPSHRGVGIGRALLAAVEAQARAEGIEYLMAYSSTKETARILDFYTQAGFQGWFVQVFKELSA